MRNVLKYRCREQGFTLLEVIVSMSLVTVAVLVALQLFAAGTRSIASSDGYVNAVATAETLMRAIQADEGFPDRLSLAGSQNGYRYDAMISKVYEERMEKSSIDLYQIRITVFWKDGTRDRAYTLSTFKSADKRV